MELTFVDSHLRTQNFHVIIPVIRWIAIGRYSKSSNNWYNSVFEYLIHKSNMKYKFWVKSVFLDKLKY